MKRMILFQQTTSLTAIPRLQDLSYMYIINLLVFCLATFT